jgi:hypothetical protein
LQSAEEYTRLPQFLRDFKKNNPTSTVVLQLDGEDCFYRLFISLPMAKELFNACCLPLLFHDGVFVKIPLCDGTILLVVAKDGNGSTVPLALAFVPSEVIEHIAWVMRPYKHQRRQLS